MSEVPNGHPPPHRIYAFGQTEEWDMEELKKANIKTSSSLQLSRAESYNSSPEKSEEPSPGMLRQDIEPGQNPTCKLSPFSFKDDTDLGHNSYRTSFDENLPEAHDGTTAPIVQSSPHSRTRPPQYPLWLDEKSADPAFQTYHQGWMEGQHWHPAPSSCLDENFTSCTTPEEDTAWVGAWMDEERCEKF